jgi:hypothetical protein
MSRIEENVRRIALKHLDLLTLKRRYRDDLDFHDLAVWEIRSALKEAYKAGAKRTPRERHHHRTQEADRDVYRPNRHSRRHNLRRRTGIPEPSQGDIQRNYGSDGR